MKIFCDLDGVVGDVVQSALSVYPELGVKDITKYHYDDYFYTNGYTWKEVFDNPKVYTLPDFQPYPHVVDVLRNWLSKGYQIEFISARPIHLEWVTEKWMQTVLGWVGKPPLTLGLSTEAKFGRIAEWTDQNPSVMVAFIEDNPKATRLFHLYRMQVYSTFGELHLIQYMQTYNTMDNLAWGAGSRTNLHLAAGWRHIENIVERLANE